MLKRLNLPSQAASFEDSAPLPGGRFRELLPKMEEHFAALSLYLADILNSFNYQDLTKEHDG